MYPAIVSSFDGPTITKKKREREKGAYFPRQKGRNSRSDTRARNARIARERRTDANTRIARYNALIQ